MSYFKFAPEVPTANFDQLVLKQELNEVYILIDFVSGRADRSLSSIDKKIHDPDDPDKFLSSEEVIKRLAKICYPPSENSDENAKDASFLLMVKDHLNTIVSPARGLTIAYTTLFTEGRTSCRTSRVKIAMDAFPSLIENANLFRRCKWILSWVGLFITVAAALLLWQVTYGAQLAARFDETKKVEVAAAGRLYAELDRIGESKNKGHNLVIICSLDFENKSSSGDQLPASSIQQLCNEYAYRRAQFCVAIADIGSFTQTITFRIFRTLLPTYGVQAPAQCLTEPTSQSVDGRLIAKDVTGGSSSATSMKEIGNHDRRIGRQEDAQSVASVLATMSNYILPILFGLVGTIAALVRGIQDKIRDSILAPRDLALVLIRLPLGMMAGVCVGLFLNPATVATQANGTVGAFTISASGIAFLAGYGAEGFFGALDNLIHRIFSFDKNEKPTIAR